MIRLLDVTLRDGGLVHRHEWGRELIRELAKVSSRSRSDIIEFGYMRDEEFRVDRAIYNKARQTDEFIVNDSISEYSLMIELPQYDVRMLEDYDGGKLKHIRIVFKPQHRGEGLEYARIAKDKGYKTHINPTGFAGYSKSEQERMIDAVNEIHPFTFTITDTYGILDYPRLREILSAVHTKLHPDIALGLHLHENTGCAYAFAQYYVCEYGQKRDISIDGSIAGIGRTAGNLPLELVMGFVNKYCGTTYIPYQLLEVEYKDIIPLLAKSTVANSKIYYALAAQAGLHPSCAETALEDGVSLSNLYDSLVQAPDAKRVIH